MAACASTGTGHSPRAEGRSVAPEPTFTPAPDSGGVGTIDETTTVPPDQPAVAEIPGGSAGDAAVVPPPADLAGQAAPAVAPPAPLQRPFADVTPAAGTWAVVVGINDYPGSAHDLRWADADADDTVGALRTLGVPADHIVSLRDGGAPAATITLAADWLVAHASADAVAVFAYAGHARKLSPSTEAIVGADGNLVTDADLANHLAPLAAKRTWLSFASCFGGGFTEPLGPGRVLTAAADADHLAYENSQLGRSYFGQFMIREALLQGRANTSVQAAFAYATNAIHQRYPGREPFEAGDLAAPLDVRQAGAAAAASSSPPPGHGAAASPSPSPSPSSTTTTAPASPSRPPASTTTTTTPSDGCDWATGGVVRCNHG